MAACDLPLDRNLLDYLEALCARAYLCVYGVRERPTALLAAFFALAQPAAGARRLAGDRPCFHRHPWGCAGGLVPDRVRSRLLRFLHRQGRAAGGAPSTPRPRPCAPSLGAAGRTSTRLGAFAAYLFFAQCADRHPELFLGFALGVPTLALIFTNGLMLGAFLALFASRGLLVELGGWLSIHGPTEFLALILSAAAGLKIAGAVLFAGREPRLVRLARDGRDAAVIMMGAVMLFLLAGLLEGLGRQLVVGMAARYLPGLERFAAVVAYFCLAGRSGGHERSRPDDRGRRSADARVVTPEGVAVSVRWPASASGRPPWCSIS